MKKKGNETIEVHMNLPRDLIEHIDANRTKKITRTHHVSEAIKAYVENLPLRAAPKLTWSIRKGS